MSIVLASSSPRRQELLRSAGLRFEVAPANIPEVPLAGEGAREFAERMAQEKALAVFGAQPDRFVLGADTVVAVDGEILGKPEFPGEATRMLRLLAGRPHLVITGVCLIGPQARATTPGFVDLRSETTVVYFGPLTDAEIAFYVNSGEPMDKAGAYAIQGIASRWISRVEGDYPNVVGLPVALVYQMLREHNAA